MSREPLPTRRPSVLRHVDWEGHHLTVAASYYPATGDIGEVFADTDKGGQMHDTLSDACTLISIALQHGITVAELSKSMAEAPDLMRGKGNTLPASPIGAILNALATA